MYYEYNFFRLDNMGSLKAKFDIVIDDCFKVSDCEVRESSNGKLFVHLPQKASNNEIGYVSLVEKYRDKILDEVLYDYSLNQKKVIHKVPETLKYKVKVHYLGADKLKAFCNLDIGFVQVSGIRIMANKEKNNLFVSMPGYDSKKLDENGKSIYYYVANPVTKEFYKELNQNILSVYDELCIKNEPNEIKLLSKTIEEYTGMIYEEMNIYIPKYINLYRNADNDTFESPMMLLADCMIRIDSMRNSIRVAHERIDELRNQLRTNGLIGNEYSEYDTLFNGIGEIGMGLAPSQREEFYKKLEKNQKSI